MTTGALLTVFGTILLEVEVPLSSSSRVILLTFRPLIYFEFLKRDGGSNLIYKVPSPPIPGSVGSSFGAFMLQKAANLYRYISTVVGFVHVPS